ncbi:hypothetical protein TTHERM_00924240 (macronuclear) [Tetrahymena thermophila SB210]|uniref:Uncharacterized protein n=1 Tax=Tetrahymena thermophila (strain SB210) TaxID=312017 RepID=Q23WM0_TETTS|nr:hypothetical protein TTHERM_00924240 [Tetrahymena thermophila SB210]EAS00960.2 hypothetical protein TTHERM_00924240 [Tetrahymena thermophila SB210]|eukprot:XP_001021205.2 hypothetical protein TTHERM_00924240 [Tetrahymena thermophila SB210]
MKKIHIWKCENTKTSLEQKIEECLNMCIYSFVRLFALNKSRYEILVKALNSQKQDNNYKKYQDIVNFCAGTIEQVYNDPLLDAVYDSTQEKYSEILFDLLKNYISTNHKLDNFNEIINAMEQYFQINLLIQDHNYDLKIDKQIDLLFFEYNEYYYIAVQTEKMHPEMKNLIQVKQEDKIQVVYTPDKISAKCTFVLFQLSDCFSEAKISENNDECEVIEKKYVKITFEIEQLIQSFLYDIIKKIIQKNEELIQIQEGINQNLSKQELKNIISQIQESKEYKNYYEQYLNLDEIRQDISKNCKITFLEDKKLEVFYKNLQLCNHCFKKKFLSYI